MESVEIKINETEDLEGNRTYSIDEKTTTPTEFVILAVILIVFAIGCYFLWKYSHHATVLILNDNVLTVKRGKITDAMKNDLEIALRLQKVSNAKIFIQDSKSPGRVKVVSEKKEIIEQVVRNILALH